MQVALLETDRRFGEDIPNNLEDVDTSYVRGMHCVVCGEERAYKHNIMV